MARWARSRAGATCSTTPPTSSSPALPWPWPSMPGSSTSAARARPIWRVSVPLRWGSGLEFLPWPIVIPLAILASWRWVRFWALIPGILQAKRGSHIVITTIMFNFIASSLMVYLINYWFRPVGKMAVESREITGAYIMSFREVAREFFDCRVAIDAAEPLRLPRHHRGLGRVVSAVAHQARLRNPRRRRQSECRRLCRHQARPHHHDHHGDFRRARRADGGERNARRAAPPRARISSAARASSALRWP